MKKIRRLPPLVAGLALAASAYVGWADLALDEASATPILTDEAPIAAVCSGSTCYVNSTGSALDPAEPDAALDVLSHDFGSAIVATSNGGPGGHFASANSVGLDATSTAPDSYAIETYANGSSGRGLVARVRSSDGVPLSLVSTGGGRLLEATTTRGIDFSIDAVGTARVSGVAIPEFGETGEPGNDGEDGEDGSKGAKGDPGRSATIAVCAQDTQDCLGECVRTVAAAPSPCQIATDINGCTWNGNDGVCCICEL